MPIFFRTGCVAISAGIMCWAWYPPHFALPLIPISRSIFFSSLVELPPGYYASFSWDNALLGCITFSSLEQTATTFTHGFPPYRTQQTFGSGKPWSLCPDFLSHQSMNSLRNRIRWLYAAEARGLSRADRFQIACGQWACAICRRRCRWCRSVNLKGWHSCEDAFSVYHAKDVGLMGFSILFPSGVL